MKIVLILIDFIFNFIFLRFMYLFNGKLIDYDESVYDNMKSYGLKNYFLNYLEHRIEINLNMLTDDLLKHEWLLLLDICYSIVPVKWTVFSRKKLNIIMLDVINSYKGWRHFRGLPTRGQRTWTNAWSVYRSNGILRNHKLSVFKKFYGDNVPEKEVTIAYVAEHINYTWKYQWSLEWFLAKTQLNRFTGHPKTMKIDLYSMYNYQIIHPLKLMKMSKKQKQSFKKNYFTLGFEPGFTKFLLNERYNIINDSSDKNLNLSGSSLLTHDERLNKKKIVKTKKNKVRSKDLKKSVWD